MNVHSSIQEAVSCAQCQSNTSVITSVLWLESIRYASLPRFLHSVLLLYTTR